MKKQLLYLSLISGLSVLSVSAAQATWYKTYIFEPATKSYVYAKTHPYRIVGAVTFAAVAGGAEYQWGILTSLKNKLASFIKCNNSFKTWSTQTINDEYALQSAVREAGSIDQQIQEQKNTIGDINKKLIRSLHEIEILEKAAKEHALTTNENLAHITEKYALARQTISKRAQEETKKVEKRISALNKSKVEIGNTIHMYHALTKEADEKADAVRRTLSESEQQVFDARRIIVGHNPKTLLELCKEYIAPTQEELPSAYSSSDE